MHIIQWTRTRIQLPALGTIKFVQKTHDGYLVETMCAEWEEGFEIDFSSSIGCVKKCHFCKSKDVKLIRNLTDEELSAQCLNVARLIQKRLGKKLTFRSFGEGEPFTNFGNIISMIHRISAKGWRSPIRFVISTTGTSPNRIEEFGGIRFSTPVELQFSLHAGDDATRERMVPFTPPLKKIVQKLRAYSSQSGKRVVCNYVPCNGLNDSPAQAHLVADLLAPGDFALVRFGTLNRVNDFPFEAASEDSVAKFRGILEARGILTERHHTEACGRLSSKITVN